MLLRASPRFGTVLTLVLLLTGGLVPGCSHYHGRQIYGPVAIPYETNNRRFFDTLAALLDTATLEGNRVEPLINGEAFLPALLKAIQNARATINLESYIYWSGEVGEHFTCALAERARAGVEVRILLDDVGSRRLSRQHTRKLRDAGVSLVFFNRLSPIRPLRVNHRDHRKIAVIDGNLGFIGGAGIADHWQGTPPAAWRDGLFRVTGPVVAQMQRAFLQNWVKVTGEAAAKATLFPALIPEGHDPAHLFTQTAGTGQDRVRLLYLAAAETARHSLRIATAYFMPDRELRDALIAASRRGVRVEIVLPGPGGDNRIVRLVSQRSLGPLLQAGVRLFEYQPSMYHAKMLVVDDQWASVGSANMDPRSFQENDEANLNVWSVGFARAVTQLFEADKAASVELTLDQWRRRPIGRRFLGTLAAPTRPLL